MPLPDHPDIEVEYEDLLGYEKAGKDDYFIGKLGKGYSVSADFLDKISTKEERWEEQMNRSEFHQHIHVSGRSRATIFGQAGDVGVAERKEDTGLPSEPVKKSLKWYEYHWVKSFGKALILAIPVAIITQMLHFGYVLEIPAVVFCLASIFFISRDPKYMYFRAGMWVLGSVGLLNILPLIDGKFDFSKKIPDGHLNWVFKLGIQDNTFISLALICVAIFLFYLNRDKEKKG